MCIERQKNDWFKKKKKRPGFIGHAHVNGKLLLPRVVLADRVMAAVGETKGKVGCIIILERGN